MAARHRVGTADDLAEDGSRIIAEVDGTEVAVFRVDGDLHAILNYCTHQAGPLCEGSGLRGEFVGADDGWNYEYRDHGRVVECPWHGWQFDVTTGENVNASGFAVPTYEVEVEDGDVYVLV